MAVGIVAFAGHTLPTLGEGGVEEGGEQVLAEKAPFVLCPGLLIGRLPAFSRGPYSLRKGRERSGWHLTHLPAACTPELRPELALSVLCPAG